MSFGRACNAATRAVAATLLAALSASAAAESASAPTVEEPEPAWRCLIVPAAAIEYPPGMAAQKSGAFVRVRLTFEAPDRPPRAKVFYQTIEDGVFTDRVLARVRDYRLPCLPNGETRVATQEFQFVPGDGRTVVTSQVRPDAIGNKVWSCITGPAKPPDYPMASTSRVSHGTVLARYTFTAADAPPTVEILFNGGNERFAAVVRDHAAGFRAPCLKPAELPVVVSQTFEFKVDGEPVTLMKDVPLASFVRTLSNIENVHVRFDFTTMGCPFEVRLTLWQPHGKNGVGEIERMDPNRREFVEWLRDIDVEVPKRLHDEIVGDSLNIAVPCGVLDLL